MIYDTYAMYENKNKLIQFGVQNIKFSRWKTCLKDKAETEELRCYPIGKMKKYGIRNEACAYNVCIIIHDSANNRRRLTQIVARMICLACL